MQFDITDNGALRVLLSDGDLCRMGLTFADLDYASPITRNALKTILLSAEAQVGFGIADPLCIEAVPVDAGCLLLFTPTETETPKFSRRLSFPAGVWQLDDADALLSFGKAVQPLAPLIRRRATFCASSLYQQNGVYLLVLYAPSLLPRGVLPILAEFAEKVGGEKAVAAVAEHGTAVCLHDALVRLTDAVSSEPTPPDLPH